MSASPERRLAGAFILTGLPSLCCLAIAGDAEGFEGLFEAGHENARTPAC